VVDWDTLHIGVAPTSYAGWTHLQRSPAHLRASDFPSRRRNVKDRVKEFIKAVPRAGDSLESLTYFEVFFGILLGIPGYLEILWNALNHLQYLNPIKVQELSGMFATFRITLQCCEMY